VDLDPSTYLYASIAMIPLIVLPLFVENCEMVFSGEVVVDVSFCK
jgi:hypothetical protein